MRLSLEKKNNNNNNNKRSRFNRVLCTIGARSLIINGADSIGSSHHRCSVPNKKNPEENNRALRLSGLGPNKRSRFNRVLCTICARSLINGADSIGSSAPSVLGP